VPQPATNIVDLMAALEASVKAAVEARGTTPPTSVDSKRAAAESKAAAEAKAAPRRSAGSKATDQSAAADESDEEQAPAPAKRRKSA
jgi:hypothetical protein